MHCDHFLMCVPIWVLIIPDYTTRADKYQQKHLVSKQGVGDKSPWIVPTKYLCHTPQGSLTCRKILRRGANGFTSPPKEVVLWAFIVLKIHRPRPGLNPRTLCPVASTKTLHHRGRRGSLLKCTSVTAGLFFFVWTRSGFTAVWYLVHMEMIEDLLQCKIKLLLLTAEAGCVMWNVQ
jgi:hypothetical protein